MHVHCICFNRKFKVACLYILCNFMETSLTPKENHEFVIISSFKCHKQTIVSGLIFLNHSLFKKNFLEIEYVFNFLVDKSIDFFKTERSWKPITSDH